MAKGGARVRSGPDQDPNSGRSERRRRAASSSTASSSTASGKAGAADALPITSTEFNPLALPARGRTGRAPAFPLPRTIRYGFGIGEGGKPVRVESRAPTLAFRKRELQLWGELWKTPQALAWEREPYRWPTVAKYCRIMASTEIEPDASAALLSRERELRNECGLSPDGLKQNGWAIAPDQLAEKRAEKKAAVPAAKKTAPVRRLRG